MIENPPVRGMDIAFTKNKTLTITIDSHEKNNHSFAGSPYAAGVFLLSENGDFRNVVRDGYGPGQRREIVLAGCLPASGRGGTEVSGIFGAISDAQGVGENPAVSGQLCRHRKRPSSERGERHCRRDRGRGPVPSVRRETMRIGFSLGFRVQI